MKFNRHSATLILFSLLFLSTSYAQDMAFLDAIKAAGANINDTGLVEMNASTESEYKSLTQNDYANTVRQIKKIDEIELLQQYRDDLREKKLELAFELCEKDESACYLLEQYQNYQDKKPNPALNELKLFGIDLFSAYPLSFNQADFSGVPQSYMLTSGDILKVNIMGKQSVNAEIAIDREGKVFIPAIGSISLAGLTLGDARKQINDLTRLKLIGSEAFVSLMSINAIQIFALGMIDNPGAYKISSVSKPINAVVAGGGFSDNASLRTIDIKRNNQVIQTLDLYDFLLFGNTAKDIRLNNGDVIFVGSVDKTISVHGGVNNPHVFEIKPGDTIEHAIKFAQGFTRDADRSKVTVSRKNNFGQYEVFTTGDFTMMLEHSDIIEIDLTKSEKINSINIVGALKVAKEFQYDKNIFLGNFLSIERDLLENTYTPYALLKRYNSKTRSSDFIEFDLMSQKSLDQLMLEPSDVIYIFSKTDISYINSQSVKKLVSSIAVSGTSNESLDNTFVKGLDAQNTLKLSAEDGLKNLQATSDQYSQANCANLLFSFGNNDFYNSTRLKYSIFTGMGSARCTPFLQRYSELIPILINSAVPVYGSVRSPGLYPITQAISAKELLSIAGNVLSPAKNNVKLDIAQSNGKNIILDISSAEKTVDIISLGVKSPSEVTASYFVKIYGEVSYPGIYPIDDRTTLTELYNQAGGLLSSAFPEAGILTRESVKDVERNALQKSEAELADILGSAITSGIIQQSTSDMLSLTSLLNQISSTQPVGRLIAELNPSTLRKNPQLNITLQPGDAIFIPKRNDVVTIYGSVLNPVTVPYNPKFSIDDYVELAGGYKDYADNNKTYYILPNGKASIPKRGLFMNQNSILPGSTIIVPRQARPLNGFSLIEAVSPILASLSITLASINSITNTN